MKAAALCLSSYSSYQELSRVPAEKWSGDGGWALTPSPPFPRRAYSPQITPKMYLLEWCRREKLAQPTYETVSFWLWPALHIGLQHSHSCCHHPQHTHSLYPGLLLGWSLALPSVGTQWLLVVGPVADNAFPLTVGLLSKFWTRN